MAAKIYYIGSKKENSDIDVAVETTAQTAPKNRISTEILKFVIIFISIALLVTLTIFSASALLRSNRGEMVVTSRLTNDEGDFAFKGWEMTPALEAAIEAGDVSLKNIIVIEKDGEIQFEGGDSNKITVVNYETVIEKNEYPKLYSDEYYQKLCREGKNTYVLRTIGLAEEKEGAE